MSIDSDNAGFLAECAIFGVKTGSGGGGGSFAANVRYVTKSGDNLTGDGTIAKPWATLSFATSQITDAKPDNAYCVKLLSDIVEENEIALKPCINLDLSGFTLNADALLLDTSWGTAFSGVINLYVTHGVISLANASVLDFTPYLSQQALVSFSDVLISQPVEFICTGVQTINLKDVGNTNGALNIKIQDASGSAISGGLVGNLDYVNTLVSAGMTVFLTAQVVTGNITLTSVEHPLVGFLIGALTLSQIFGDGVQVVVYTSVTLVQYPTMTNSAQWYPIQLNSLQSTIFVTKWGNDSYGDGSNINAYQTITKALTSPRLLGITPENPADIIVFGESADASMPALPPNVNIVGINASTTQFIEIDSTAWQSALENSQNSITNFNSPGFFCNCISPAFTPVLNLSGTEFSTGFFANCILNISSSKTVNNPSTSNLITFQSVTLESINNFYNTTEFLIQNGSVNFKNDQFANNLKTIQNNAEAKYMNCSTSTLTINASDTASIRSDGNFAANLTLSDSAVLYPIANTIDYSARANITASYNVKLPVPYYIYVNMLSSSQVLTLPPVSQDGVPTIPIGTRIYIESAVASSTFAINLFDSTLFRNVDAKESFYLVLNNNSSEAGVWEEIITVQTVNGFYGQAELTGGNISANYATPTNYTPLSAEIEGHLQGINNALNASPSSLPVAGYYTIAPSVSGFGFSPSDTTYFVPLYNLTTYKLENGFTIAHDGNTHIGATCNDTQQGLYDIEVIGFFRTINRTTQGKYAVTIGINSGAGYTPINLSGTTSLSEIPFDTYGNTDATIIPFVWRGQVIVNPGNIVAPMIRSTDGAIPYDTYMIGKGLFFTITKIENTYNAEAISKQSSNAAAVAMTQNVIYFNNYASGQAVFTAPATPADKSVIGIYSVNGSSTSGWKINASGSQKFQLATVGGIAGGSITSTVGSNGDGFEATYNASTLCWVVTNAIGNDLTLV